MQRACFPSRGCQQHQSVFGARSRPRTRSCALRTVCSCNSSQHEKYAVSRRQLGLLVGSATLLSSGNFWAEAAEAPAALGFESRVCEFTLSNGLHFIVLERHNAPVVACHTHARVGAYVEEEGGTGLAHLLEHMAFKGTARIGSRDWSREQAMLQAQDEVFYELREMKQTAAASGSSSSISAKMQQLQDKFTQLKAESDELVVPNAFGSMLQQAGAVGLNAVTSHDDTRYYNLLPSNKLELWFALESERFQAPVFRQLYTEKEVIAEERRARWENSPIGRFTASYLLQALDNPYRCPVIGFADDFERFGSHEVREFFDRYYHPANLTITIVGDVDPAQAQQLAQQYFGTWAPAPQAVTLDSNLLQLAAERLPRSPAVTMGPVAAAAWQGSVTTAAADGSGSSYAMTLAHRSLSGNSSASSKGSSKGLWGLGAGAAQATPAGESDPFLQRTAAGPLLALGYYRPSLTGRKGTALEVAGDILSGGRSARLIQDLVLKGSCLSASCSPGYPGELHPGLALVSAVPQSGDNLKHLSGALQQQLDRLAQYGPTPAELARVKASARTGLLSALTSNGSMAGLLASYHAVSGSWRGVLSELNDVETLTAAEVAEVADQVFHRENAFTGMGLPL